MSTLNDSDTLNSYRLTSMEEPTDEMLSAIMREAAEEAAQRKQIATNRFFAEIERMLEATFANSAKPTAV